MPISFNIKESVEQYAKTVCTAEQAQSIYVTYFPPHRRLRSASSGDLVIPRYTATVPVHSVWLVQSAGILCYGGMWINIINVMQ